MIKRINQYLLTNHPIIWNIRVVPLAICLLIVEVVLFGLGFIITDTNATDFQTSRSVLYYLIYSGAVLIALLVFIFWLIQYNRNNGLKVHYPQSNISLYLEWLLIFGICILIGFIPNSLSIGKSAKWKSTVSEKKFDENTKLLLRMSMLLPENTYSYELNHGQMAIAIDDYMNVDTTKFDTKIYAYEEDALTPTHPMEYIGPSLLYYKDNPRNYYAVETEDEEIARVHRWLENENKDSIEATIQDFLDLHKKHDLKTNVDMDYCMKIIYNPPFYPVEKITERSDYSITNHITQKYTQADNLQSYYAAVGEHYEKDGFNKWYILITISIALGFSVMVFSARITSGKSLVFALLTSGVIGFAFSLFMGFASIMGIGSFSTILMPLFWLALLAVILYLVTLKVVNGKSKGNSNIYINLAIWYIPAIIPWLYQLFFFSFGLSSSTLDDSMFVLLIVNIIFTTVVMFPTVILLRKWKALPEE